MKKYAETENLRAQLFKGKCCRVKNFSLFGQTLVMTTEN